jgi:hypothetical protein
MRSHLQDDVAVAILLRGLPETYRRLHANYQRKRDRSRLTIDVLSMLYGEYQLLKEQ